MNCREAQHRLPGYLDGAIREDDRVRLRGHLDSCGTCREQLEGYRLLAGHLANFEPVAPPPGLALRIRLQASQERSPWDGVRRAWSRVVLVSQNILKPLAVPATGGVLTAVAVFVFVTQSMLMGMPIGGVATDDLPLNLVQPAQLESLAPFPVPDIGETDGRANSGPLLLEATLNAQGEVLFYKILSGPNTPVLQRQMDQLLLFSRFRPQLGFGRPMGGGRVLLSFSEVRVRG
ncbi:MAG TPA: zf-HC2 domain-containing protein [Candidatus Acidoferrales bacterium]|nr:zf-HC2 domain-containing protein [Candidatus Acidoferrales bacterium]